MADKNLGHIYLITNTENNKRYVGQTSRDVWDRFEEHLWEKEGSSQLHQDILIYGRKSFKISELETVEIGFLDSCEKKWIDKLQTQLEYNTSVVANFDEDDSLSIYVKEKGFSVGNLNNFIDKVSLLTSWKKDVLERSFLNAIKNRTGFLGYHYRWCNKDTPVIDTDIIDDWIKTVNLLHQGKHIYSPELNLHFANVADAVSYCITNHLYKSDSYYPEQELKKAIETFLDKESIENLQNISFETMYGECPVENSTTNSVTEIKEIYCPELNKTFNSIDEAATFFAKNELVGKAKAKTLKSKITNVCNGVFKEYKGFQFQKVSKEG